MKELEEHAVPLQALHHSYELKPFIKHKMIIRNTKTFHINFIFLYLYIDLSTLLCVLCINNFTYSLIFFKCFYFRNFITRSKYGIYKL